MEEWEQKELERLEREVAELKEILFDFLDAKPMPDIPKIQVI